MRRGCRSGIRCISACGACYCSAQLMSRFTDLKLYWEDWGGYPDRDYPFGNPTLMWLIASKQAAARCVVRSEAQGAMTVNWSASWENISPTLVEPLPALLHDIG